MASSIKTTTDIGIDTKTRTQAVFQTKIALATAFLGGAVLAASGVDAGLSKPDLVVDDVAVSTIEQGTLVEVLYSNHGPVQNRDSFALAIQLQPQSGAVIDRINHVVDVVKQQAGNERTTLFIRKAHSPNTFVIPIDAEFRSENLSVTGLNEYALGSGETGIVQIVISSEDADKLHGDASALKTVIDFDDSVDEIRENNNAATYQL